MAIKHLLPGGTIGGFTLFNSAQTPTITITDALSAKLEQQLQSQCLMLPLDNFKVVAGTSQAGGVPFDVTVTARDNYWNTCIDYTGSIRFKSSDDSKVTFLPVSSRWLGTTELKLIPRCTYKCNRRLLVRAADAVLLFKSGEQQNIL